MTKVFEDQEVSKYYDELYDSKFTRPWSWICCKCLKSQFKKERDVNISKELQILLKDLDTSFLARQIEAKDNLLFVCATFLRISDLVSDIFII